MNIFLCETPAACNDGSANIGYDDDDDDNDDDDYNDDDNDIKESCTNYSKVDTVVMKKFLKKEEK